MVAVLDAHHADAVDGGHFARFAHAQFGGDEAEAIVGVDLGYDGGDFFEGGLGGGGEDFLPDASHVGRDAVDAVGVHAAEVGGDEAFGDCEGVLFGNAVALEDGGYEGGGVLGCDVVFRLILRLVGHGGWGVIESFEEVVGSSPFWGLTRS